MNIAVYINSRLKESNDLQMEVTHLLVENNLKYKWIEKNNLSDWADIVLVIGGDGTILRMAKSAVEHNVKILAVNAGNLGFLTAFEKSNLKDAIQFLKAGNYYLDNRSLLECKVNGQHYLAVNEFAIHADYTYSIKKENVDKNSKVIRASIQLNNRFVTNIVASGVLVSTPTGSTAYSLSAGGAILTPNLPAFIYTPIVANSLTSRSIVYRDDNILSIELQEKSANAILLCDGENIAYLPKDSKIQIYKADKFVTFIRRVDDNFFENYKKRVEK